MANNLLEVLYDNEAIFVEEIDHLEKHPEQVSFIVADDGISGWLCLKAEEGTSDWNIVRAIGDFEKCQQIISKIPFADYVLIGNETDEAFSQKSLIYYESSGTYGDDENEAFELNKYANIEFGLPLNSIKTKVSQIDSRLDDIYLYQRNGIQGFIKVTRNSWHYAEVAIEIKPELRNQGYGTALLALMIEQARRKNVKLSYVVESDNVASIAIADKCGLHRLISFALK